MGECIKGPGWRGDVWDNVNGYLSQYHFDIFGTSLCCLLCFLTINPSIKILRIAYFSECTSAQLEIWLSCCLLEVFYRHTEVHPESCYSTVLSIDKVLPWGHFIVKKRRNGEHSQPHQKCKHIVKSQYYYFSNKSFLSELQPVRILVCHIWYFLILV